MEVLTQIKHKHVLQLSAYNSTAKYPQKDGVIIPSVLLVLEYAPGGQLFDLLYHISALSEKIATTYFKTLMEGIQACHKLGICHGNIKSQYLLLDANFQLKVADCVLRKAFGREKLMHG